MARVVLHLGSNLGKRIKNLALAAYFINKKIGPILEMSGLYETEAWGKSDQSDFLNLVIISEYADSPEELLLKIHWIENKLGRIRFEKWGERLIDIDILFFGDQIIEKANLKIPHPEITNRNFVLVPLNEIMPEFIHPVLERPIRDLMEQCEDTKKVRLLEYE